MHPFEQHLLAAWPPDRWRDLSVLVAVSGGPDSVALLRALGAVKSEAGGEGRIVVGHFNHGWRGAASDADAAFVAALAARLGLPCHVGRAEFAVSAPESSHGESREGRARDERYAFLQRAAESIGARYVVTAHTADDQAETILHHILRGTGLAGLAGMPRARELGSAATLLRPLLAVRRGEVLDYLAALGQDFRHDATNDDLRHTRNRLRHDLLPRIEADIQPRAIEALCRLGQLAGEAHEILARAADELLSKHIVFAPHQIVLDCRGLDAEPVYLVREMLLAAWRRQGWPLQEMTLARWEELAELIRAPDDALPRMLPGSLRACRTGAALTVVQTPALEAD